MNESSITVKYRDGAILAENRMNYLPIRIVPDKTVHKATSIAITAILVSAMFVGLIPIVPAAAAANMSVSQTRIGNTNAIKITVSDTALTNHPTVTLSWGTAQSQSLTNNMIRTPLGEWILFIANSTSTKASLRNAPSYTNSTIQNNATAIGDAQKSLIERVGFVDAGAGVTSATLTYGERNEQITITLGESNVASATADRTTVPPNAKVKINVTDASENFDPTAKDGSGPHALNFNFTNVNVLINGVNKTYTTATPGNATETEISSGIFTLTLDLNNAAFNEANGDLVTVVIRDSDDTTKSTSVDLLIQSADGTLSAPASVTYSTDLLVTLNDSDRNLDTTSQETLSSSVATVVATIGTSTVTGTLNLKETGKNTGVFTGTVRVNLGAAAAVAGSPSTTLIFSVPAGSATSFVASYTDPTSLTVGHTAQASFTLSIATPTIALSSASYLPAASMPTTIALTNANANDNSTSVERIVLKTATNLSTINFLNANATSTGLPVIGKFNITETKSGVTRTLNFSGLNGKQFVENGANTGVFVLNLDLATNLNGTRTSGSTITVKYYDAFSKTTITSSATIGGTLATITLDRTTLPVSLGKEARVTVTLTDQDSNSNPSAINTATVRLTVANATNQRLAFSGGGHTRNITVTETGVNTGTFNATIRYTIVSDTGIVAVYDPTAAANFTLTNTNSTFNAAGANVKGRQMVNGKLTVGFADPVATSGVVDVSAQITPSTATLSVSPASVILNQSLTVTVTEADENVNPLVKDTIRVNELKGTTALTSLSLTETGVNTGVFTASKRVGTGGQSPFNTLVPGDSVTVKYIDNATTASYYGTGLTTSTLTGSASIPTSTATLSISATSYGPFSKIVINVTDADLVFNSTTPASVTLARLQTSKLVYENVPANTSLGAGAYQWTLTLYVNGTTVKNIMTAPVDSLSVYFVDKIDASGNTGVISSKTASISSMTGQVVVSPSSVLVGQYFTTTVTDSDQNKDPNVIESITVSVTSTSWPIGQTITLPETAPNSGVFSAQVQVSSGLPSGNQIRGATGDTITAKYTDRWNSSGLQSIVSTTTTVGTSQVATERVPASTPSLRDTSGNVVAAPTAGSLVVVQAAVRNNATTSQTFTYIVQIKNANGQVVFLNWIQNMTLAAGQTSTPGISWTPSAAGTYTIQVFVWDSLTGAQARSPVFTQTVTVS